MRGVDFVDEDLGFAVGSRSVLVSTDGGRTWAVSDTTTFAGRRLQAVTVDSTIAGVVVVVVGSEQTIGRSANAGTSWRLVHSGNDADLNATCFRGDGSYDAFGEGAWLAQSLDYGLSWNTGLVFPSADMNVALCRPDGTVWVGGFWNDAGINRCCGVLMKSTDGGDSWTVVVRPEDPDQGNFVDMQFISADVGFALSSTASSFRGRSLVWKTTDGGETWEPISTHPFMNAMLFIDEQLGVLGGEEGQLRTTFDGGTTWVSDTLSPQSTIRDFERVGDAIIAVGDLGVFRNENLIVLSAAESLPDRPDLESAVFPNPAGETATIRFERTGSFSQPLRVELVDVTGRIIRSVRSDAATDRLDLHVGDLPPGIYFYRAWSGSATDRGRFFVVR